MLLTLSLALYIDVLDTHRQNKASQFTITGEGKAENDYIWAANTTNVALFFFFLFFFENHTLSLFNLHIDSSDQILWLTLAQVNPPISLGLIRQLGSLYWCRSRWIRHTHDQGTLFYLHQPFTVTVCLFVAFAAWEALDCLLLFGSYCWALIIVLEFQFTSFIYVCAQISQEQCKLKLSPDNYAYIIG